MSQVEQLQRIQDNLSQVPESTVYSSEVTRAIQSFSTVGTITDALALMRDNTDYHNLLFRRPEQEGRELTNFLRDLGRIPSLPAQNVDFI